MNFALLSDGKSCILGWGAFKRSPEPQKNAFYINNFDLSQSESWYVFEHTKRFEVGSVKMDEEPLATLWSKLPLSSDWMLGDYEVFRENFQESLEALKAGDLKKILLSVCDLSERSEKSLASKVNSFPQLPYFFYAYNFEGKGAWGLSPELLFEHDAQKKTLKTMALAGTFTDQVEERHTPEHNFVLDFFSDLATEFDSLIHFNKIVPSEYGRIKHLKSEILLENIPDKNLNEWIKAFHPTPALGVLPRTAENMDFLRMIRKDLPANFGAPFGFREENYTRLIVMIRGVFFDHSKLYRPIGVGVTAATNLEAEWKEISQKRFAMEGLWQLLT